MATVLWALLPLLLGVPAGPCFLWAAYRLRSRFVAAEGLAYLALTVAVFVTSQPNVSPDLSGWLGLALMVTATVRAFVLRRRLFFRSGDVLAGLQVSAAALPPGWTPMPDPTGACSRQDTHVLITSQRSALVHAGIGAVGGAFVLGLHLGDRLGTLSVAYMSLPVFVALFNRWVDGPLLHYRICGARRVLRLDAVKLVEVSGVWGARSTLVLRAPGRRAIRVALQTASFSMPGPAVSHLQAWLDRPDVAISPAARTLLRGGRHSR